LADEVARLQRENQRLKEQLRQAELIIDVQKKVSEMLNIPLKTPDGEEAD
jgi:cell shape-determining protein MreC